MTVGTIDELMARLGRERAAREQRARDEFFGSAAPIPDLDLMPPCSICDGSLEYDEGFYCPGCNVGWTRSGDNGRREVD